MPQKPFMKPNPCDQTRLKIKDFKGFSESSGQGDSQKILSTTSTSKGTKASLGVSASKNRVAQPSEFDIMVRQKIKKDQVAAQALAKRKIDLGTKQTRKYRLACPVRRLLEAGKIEAPLYRAALDLEKIIRILSGQTGYAISKYQPRTDRSWSVQDEAADRQRLNLIYNDWRNSISAKSRQVTMALLFEHAPMRLVEQQAGIRNGAATILLIDSLKVFHKKRVLLERHLNHFVKNMRDSHDYSA